MVGLRTDGTTGGVFAGAPPSIGDVDGNGAIDDGQTNFYTSHHTRARNLSSWAPRYPRFCGSQVPVVVSPDPQRHFHQRRPKVVRRFFVLGGGDIPTTWTKL